MDTSTSVLYAATGLPALVSTRITILYFFLKACSFVINAISIQTKRRVAMPMTSGSEQKYCTNPREESDGEIHQQIQRHISETRQYGGRPEWPTGTVLLSRRGQNIFLPSFRNGIGNPTEPAFRENAEGLQSRRHWTPKGHYGKRPKDSRINATRISEECGQCLQWTIRMCWKRWLRWQLQMIKHILWWWSFGTSNARARPKCQDHKNASN